MEHDRSQSISGNHLQKEGSTIVKKYARGQQNMARELKAIKMLHGLPVPRIVEQLNQDTVRFEFIEGINGTEAIERGGASTVLREMGKFLRLLHAKTATKPVISPTDIVLVHGDFGPYNCLFRPDNFELVAVLDWEDSSYGNPISDVSWCEYQFSNSFSSQRYAISSLYEGFQFQPKPDDMSSELDRRLSQLNSNNACGKLIEFKEIDQAAAYLAALTRHLSYPDACQTDNCYAIWIESKSQKHQIILDQVTFAIAVEAFGIPANATDVPMPFWPPIFFGKSGRGIGIEESALLISGKQPAA